MKISQLKNTNLIDGSAGKLEIVVDIPKHLKFDNKLMIICHPHPKYLGNMNNKVVTTISKAAQNSGLLAIRFNYRGVGKSEGYYGNGIGEIDDLLSVASWAKKNTNNIEIILAGFSFGASVAYRSLERLPCSHLITIAPAIINFPLTTYTEPQIPWLIIQGDNDEIILPKDVFKWLNEEVKTSYTLYKMSKACHFFHGRLIELRNEIENYIKVRIQ